jgi:hypothetical protein
MWRIVAAMLMRARTVEGVMNYTGAMSVRPRFHAVDHSRDNLALEPATVAIEDARHSADPPRLDREGFALVPHTTAVSNFRDADEVRRINAPEVERLIAELTGADAVVCNSPGVLRFGERSPESGKYVNSYPARFIHVDVSDPTGATFAERAKPAHLGNIKRFAHYNVWRVLSPPPQDVPLAVCDARTVEPADLMGADAIFDGPNAPEWSFEGLVVHRNPRHRWVYFSGMTPDEVLVFKTNDSDPSEPHNVPHSAFDDPTCPPGVTPRASIEMRAIAFWLA